MGASINYVRYFSFKMRFSVMPFPVSMRFDDSLIGTYFEQT